MLIAFAVFDVKAAAYGNPMFISNAGLAIRGFSDACHDPATAMAKHPGDYSLFEIGSYDPNSGILKAVSPPVHVASAASMLALKEQPVGPELPFANSVAGDTKSVAA